MFGSLFTDVDAVESFEIEYIYYSKPVSIVDL